MEYLVTRRFTSIEEISEWVKSNLVEIKRGDMISLQEKKYRFKNDWTFIWNGDKIVELEFEHDKCGHLPREFKVSHTEFSPKWWINLIDNNYIFWLSDEIKYSMIFKRVNNIIFSDVCIGKESWRCFVLPKKKRDYICVDKAIFHCDGFAHLFPPFAGPCFYMELLD